MVKNLKKFISPRLKSKLVSLHFLNSMRARRLAATSKRLDLCAAQFALLLHLVPDMPVRNKTCLEIGSGWVLSHALICYLLGAQKIIATDVVPMANPEHLRAAVHKAEQSIIRDVLAPYCEHSEVRERLNRLLSIKKFTFEALKGLGIEYRAPFDFAKQNRLSDVDFIYSFAVMEHIPVNDVFPLLNNVTRSLRPGGAMVHCIHLEDHKDFDRPFDFLSINKDSYPREVQTIRSNRIRRSQWHNIFSQLNDIDFHFIYEWKRNDRSLPEEIDQSISYEDDNDLRVSHLGVYAVKKESASVGPKHG
jgi:cyclopropane fatty-acyl-phospholipid synthase-like methyltransferase